MDEKSFIYNKLHCKRDCATIHGTGITIFIVYRLFEVNLCVCVPLFTLPPSSVPPSLRSVAIFNSVHSGLFSGTTKNLLDQIVDANGKFYETMWSVSIRYRMERVANKRIEEMDAESTLELLRKCSWSHSVEREQKTCKCTHCANERVRKRSRDREIANE